MLVFIREQEKALDARLNVRLPQSERDDIEEDARLAGMSMSELVRARYFGRPIVASADKMMIRELRRLGGLLKSVHLESNGAYSKQTADAIVMIIKYITELSKKK